MRFLSYYIFLFSECIIYSWIFTCRNFPTVWAKSTVCNLSLFFILLTASIGPWKTNSLGQLSYAWTISKKYIFAHNQRGFRQNWLLEFWLVNWQFFYFHCRFKKHYTNVKLLRPQTYSHHISWCHSILLKVRCIKVMD